MFKPKLYQKSNSDTKRDAFECLEKYSSRMEWKEGCRVMDVGCGDGGLTVDVLRQFLPPNFGMLVGADIGPDMVAHACSRYGDQRTKFIVLDIGGDIPKEHACNFDHVFSCYTVHWIQDKERAFANIYKLLDTGGRCLLLFVRYSPIQDVIRILACHPRWQPWLTDVERYVSPYRDLKNPEITVKEIMQKVGFENIHVECEDKEYIYEEQQFRNTMEAICPFKIPSEEMDDYMDDYMMVVKDMNRIYRQGDKSMVKMNYTLLAAFGCKNNN
ncbi:methyltransferase domain-containing protein [Phthorimaea operculella]|nr:methyltransferase domain-containing protein [Phthorimaea operculella]